MIALVLLALDDHHDLCLLDHYWKLYLLDVVVKEQWKALTDEIKTLAYHDDVMKLKNRLDGYVVLEKHNKLAI